MVFVLSDGQGFVVYEGRSWPMARSALDHVLLKDDDGVPKLEILPEEDPKM